ncbi:hypothetical protein PoB_002608900 [Plakobranchus ocellatus]|uniref:Uncharacterized protein n=1 Tax=Plakobranchus ocellatus TaxID=259542 RepID=A0AAV3ZWA5_9GAST|nr:hypothetical protein PoB_002608900 [Plakobranchus ocellatus]
MPFGSPGADDYLEEIGQKTGGVSLKENAWETWNTTNVTIESERRAVELLVVIGIQSGEEKINDFALQP